MRTKLVPAILLTAGALAAQPALAQSGPPAAKAAQAPAAIAAKPQAPAATAAKPQALAAADPVIARVGGSTITMSDLDDAARNLPEQAQAIPKQTLYPMLLDRLISSEALAEEARKQGLDKQPEVKRALEHTVNQTLANALLSRDVGPSITEQAIQAAYDATYKGKPGPEEVHARHILVDSEDQAKKIIVQLKAGADFAKLAAQYSTEPGAKDRGGDLGFFKQTDMVPEFADAAFKLKPGEFTQTPVKTQFGWHVIKVEERRASPAPTLEKVHDELRDQLMQAGVKKSVAAAMQDVKVEQFNLDGSPQRATDQLEPPDSK